MRVILQCVSNSTVDNCGSLARSEFIDTICITCASQNVKMYRRIIQNFKLHIESKNESQLLTLKFLMKCNEFKNNSLMYKKN